MLCTFEYAYFFHHFQKIKRRFLCYTSIGHAYLFNVYYVYLLFLKPICGTSENTFLCLFLIARITCISLRNSGLEVILNIILLLLF